MAYVYCGAELDLFAAAENWKSYIRAAVRRYLGRVVLEVGAGNGNTTRALCRGEFERWVCLEPDAALADQLSSGSGRRSYPTAATFESARWLTSMSRINLIRFSIWTCSNTSRTTARSSSWRRVSSRGAGI